MIFLDNDFETVSKVDLKKCGLDAYARDPSTRVLMFNYQIHDESKGAPGPVHVWLPHEEPIPSGLHAMILDPKVRKVAHNAAFEIAIFNHVLGIATKPRDWYCTMVMALSLGLPGKLEYLVRDALKLDRKYWKDPEGDRLMRLFSYPSSTATPESHPEEFRKYIGYGRQDVVAEAKVFSILRRYVTNMGKLFDGWCLDQRINQRGLPVDLGFIESAQKIAAVSKAEYRKEMDGRTGLKNSNSTQQLLPWLEERGYPFASIAKNRVGIAVKDFADRVDDEAKELLALRLESNKTSLAKYDALKRASRRGRLRGTYQYYGAAATGRYAGRILGQNMPRPADFVEDYLGEARDMIAREDLDEIKMFFGKPLEVLSSSIRSAIATRPGRKLIVADLASIELCVIAWWTGAKFWLDVVESGKDAYKAFGERWLLVPYDEITKFQRKLSKPPALGCFAAATEILTKRGWIQIIGLRADDLVFDGVEFVRHDGVVDQGVKRVIEMHGVSVTPDHLVLCGGSGWQTSESVAREVTYTHLATEWATGQCLPSSATKSAESTPGTTGVSANSVGSSTSSIGATLSVAKRLAATSARAASRMKRGVRFTAGSALARSMSSVCRIAFSLCERVALAAQGRSSNTQVAESSADSTLPKISSATPSRLMGGTTRSYTPIESTMTGTTSRATSGSSLAQPTNETNGPTYASSTEARAWSSKIFTSVFARVTGIALRCVASWLQEPRRRKSLTASRGAEARTYDVLNAGPRNRFVIRTDAGPMIVHNCGYRMGPGREVGVYPDTEKTGLWGYAANMGVAMTKEECKAAVKVYRELSPEIVQAWYDVERAALACVETGEPQRAGMLSFDLRTPFLRMRLPSGRYVHYCRPRIEEVEIEYEDEDGNVVVNRKLGLTYERLSQSSGKWVRRSQHGGRFAEQATQAIALDLLQSGIENAERAGLNVIGHYHDEILCEVDADSPLGVNDLVRAMTKLPDWAFGLTLRAEGYESNFYRK